MILFLFATDSKTYINKDSDKLISNNAHRLYLHETAFIQVGKKSEREKKQAYLYRHQ
jgi:hypothetical protein